MSQRKAEQVAENMLSASIRRWNSRWRDRIFDLLSRLLRIARIDRGSGPARQRPPLLLREESTPHPIAPPSSVHPLLSTFHNLRAQLGPAAIPASQCAFDGTQITGPKSTSCGSSTLVI